MKRKEYLSWDQYFMGVAKLSAMRSKDPDTQVGCCIVDEYNHIISLGYNGLPCGCDDNEYPWQRSGKDSLDNKYWYVVHSEINAILNANGRSLKNCKLYVSLFPCNECAKAIIQSGITEIIYEDDKYADTDSTKASKRMFKSAKVKLRQLKKTNKKIILSI
ncbi:deoxycytidylate deaminase [Candidatus Malacoplasma girerdii]|uniref:Deoxycytidylate deaminase n=1 Tax=Candidatus Malacoplasma girerdii TaxID=1318617 RepID=A0A097SS57_9BACT|nr:deoxycytidylate deaminase [Candidatus Malacoplasma girerdii]ASJ88959.1 MAG: deoxycytidylate deaminase [Candidatus Malacoplasma girerdii]